MIRHALSLLAELVKPFRRPWLWLCLWAVMVIVVVVGSLSSPPPAPRVAMGDKWLHLGAYYLVSVAAVQVFRRWRPLVQVSAGAVALGVALECAQGALTDGRVLDPYDALANAVGVIVGMSASLFPARDALLGWERRSG